MLKKQFDFGVRIMQKKLIQKWYFSLLLHFLHKELQQKLKIP